MAKSSHKVIVYIFYEYIPMYVKAQGQTLKDRKTLVPTHPPQTKGKVDTFR